MSQPVGQPKRNMIIRLVVIFLLFFAANLALDRTLSAIPPYLSKHRAFESIQVGDDIHEAREILWRAGIGCASESMFKCQTVMFSDFWRTYSVSFDSQAGIAVEKKFTFRIHGKGLLGRLHIWKS